MLAGRVLSSIGLSAALGIVLPLLLATDVILDDDVAAELLHDIHGHGAPSFFINTERSFSAGPNFIPNEFIKWSSVNSGKPDPSMHCSRKFYMHKRKRQRSNQTKNKKLKWKQRINIFYNVVIIYHIYISLNVKKKINSISNTNLFDAHRRHNAIKLNA